MTVATLPQSELKAGIFPNLSRAGYEAIDAINCSSLEHFERTAAHARAQMLHPRKPTDAMDLGNALHCALLEPQRFFQDYAAAPKDADRRTKNGKALWAAWEIAHPNVEPIDFDEFNDIQRIREAIAEHSVASKLLGGGMGYNEISVVFVNEETGLLCKARLDRITTYAGWTFIVDLKSTRDASRREFSLQIKKLHYGAKAAFYHDAVNAIAPMDRRFVWIAFEKVQPYAIALYEADESAIAAGRSKYMRWLRNYQDAKKTNVWIGYPEEIQQLTSQETEFYS